MVNKSLIFPAFYSTCATGGFQQVVMVVKPINDEFGITSCSSFAWLLAGAELCLDIFLTVLCTKLSVCHAFCSENRSLEHKLQKINAMCIWNLRRGRKMLCLEIVKDFNISNMFSNPWRVAVSQFLLQNGSCSWTRNVIEWHCFIMMARDSFQNKQPCISRAHTDGYRETRHRTHSPLGLHVV